MTRPEVDTLEAALLSTLKTARALGTWDCEWYDYAPQGWQHRVRNAPPALVRELRVYVATYQEHVLFQLVAEIDRLMRLDADFADALIGLYSRENTPICLAEVLAHHVDARDAR